ncbi:hypothetical protein [Leptospira stimsonii]|uniref:Uncharacterized protein n=1 Tax=Leptospira stimsonii TaxID=2202203 RepID=A0A396Z4R3_9LEPT|nr:hypothetical protein [Leptospira stimsonii]RHX89133.1 hypothetical protein DLM75_14845 [Leptospira stimsonii]
MASFPKFNKKEMFLLTLLLLSITLNLFFVFRKIPQAPNHSSEREAERNSVPKNEITKEWISSAEILPHPPGFLKGRKIRFLSYQVRKSGGKSWILFNEKRGTEIVQTKVDAEAVQWF